MRLLIFSASSSLMMKVEVVTIPNGIQLTIPYPGFTKSPFHFSILSATKLMFNDILTY
jgi:hypothetical protein